MQQERDRPVWGARVGLGQEVERNIKKGNRKLPQTRQGEGETKRGREKRVREKREEERKE